ncbi:MAG: hypothetical protein PHW32_00835 [Bacilli bacterium]|nr:hypothetical protein [Bacilli bacterium]MDD4283008.1 hypothetical protein [Bacilli bacterium]MDD4718933.1 hypothetical protein [Bacilli bacterium]
MKNIKIIYCLLIVFLLVGCNSKKLKLAEEKNVDYVEQITDLTEKLTRLSDENVVLLEKVEKYEPEIYEEGECDFTRTYHIIDIMNYQTSDNASKFIILDQFQAVNPFIVNLPEDQVAKVTKGKTYEFTFRGDKKYQKSEYNELFKKFELNNIKETDRVGLNQLQDPCR